MNSKKTPLTLYAIFILLLHFPNFLLAQKTKTKSVNYVTVPANVSYPTVLKGNEGASKDYVEKFAKGRKDYVIRMHKKGATNFPKIVTTFKKYNLAEEYRVLIALESAFNGDAVSPVGAVGYWQLMDGVAKEYGINYIPRNSKESSSKKPLVDDRKNFNKSTIVAAKYLRDRTRNLKNNILLIVASYNCGIGNVWKAMKKTGKTNPTFWDVKQYLPMETRNYVMNFISLNVLFHNYNKLIENNLTFNPTKKIDTGLDKSTAKAF